MSISLPVNGNIYEYRFYVTLTTISYEVFPLNFLATSLIDSQTEGQAFYRRTFNGELVFGTNSFTTDDSGAKEIGRAHV